ncbi:unnamed protein product [Prunus armeniaca]
MSKVQYASAVGFLIYTMVCTCPDLAQAGTKKLGILFERQQRKTCMLGFLDSDYAGDIYKRRSTAGYVFTCGGGLISWRVVLQSVTALSTTEAEYMEEALMANKIG